MCRAAKDGGHLAYLVVDAAALCIAAQNRLPLRTGPGRPDTYQQWQIAVLIVIAILHRRKSKSSQWRWLQAHAPLLLKIAALKMFVLPSRATYMRRYAQVWQLLELAIEIGGRDALIKHLSSAKVVAVDKSMIAARGLPRPHPFRVQTDNRFALFKGVDLEAGWGKSEHDGWVWGYSYEVVVCAGKEQQIVPILASVGPANTSEHSSFAQKITRLPRSTRHVLADRGYDGNKLAEALEYDRHETPTGRHLLCPMIARGGNPPCAGKLIRKGRRERLRQHRIRRSRYFKSPLGRCLYKRRMQSVEPFNQWLKHCFYLEERVWHRGLANNRTMLLATIFIYQSLQRYNAKLGNTHGNVQWILDAL